MNKKEIEKLVALEYNKVNAEYLFNHCKEAIKSAHDDLECKEQELEAMTSLNDFNIQKLEITEQENQEAKEMIAELEQKNKKLEADVMSLTELNKTLTAECHNCDVTKLRQKLHKIKQLLKDGE